MGKTKNRLFGESARYNKQSWWQYYERLEELAITRFKWENMPDTVDTRFLELITFRNGQCVFFKDCELGFMALQNAKGNNLNPYGIPNQRRAYAINGYQKDLDQTNSVIIYNNYMHTNGRVVVENFARKLWNIDRTIDVNANAQKTPILISCDEDQKLVMENAYMQYEGNQPVIFGMNALKTDGLKVWRTDAPYLCDRLYDLKTQIWNEALTYLGISNMNVDKKERMLTGEVMSHNGGTVASRYSGLEARKEAAEQINKMFGLNIDVTFREDTGVKEAEYEIDKSEDF